MVQPDKVPELNVVRVCTRGVIVGAAVTVDKLEKQLTELVGTVPGI